MSQGTTEVLAFVANDRQWSALHRSGLLTTRSVVASMDLDVTWRLRRSSIPVVDLFSFLDSAAIERNARTAWDLCTGIRESVGGRIRLAGCDLVERSVNDVFYAFLCLLNTACATTRVLAATTPREIAHFGEVREIPLWDPPDPAPDVFNSCVASIARHRKLPTEVLWTGTPQGEERTGELKPAATPRLPSCRLWDRCGGRTLLFCCSAVFAREQELLWESLAAHRGDWQPVLVSDAREVFGLPSVPARAWLNPPLALGHIEAKARELANDFPRVVGDLAGSVCESLGNSAAIDQIWRAYCGCLTTCARQYMGARLLARAFAPRLVVTDYDIYGVRRCFQQAFRDDGIPVLSIDHVCLSGAGPISSGRRNQGAKSHVAVWGEVDAAAQRTWRDSEAKIFCVGSLRRDVDAAEQAGQGRTERSDAPPSIVLFTAEVTSTSGTICDTVRLEKTWMELKALMARRTTWQFRLKRHPRYDYEDFYDATGVLNERNVRLETGDAAEALRQADVAVLVNTPSSVAIEAVLRGVPVVFLVDAALDVCRKNWVLGQGVRVVPSVHALEEEIARVVGEPEYRERILARERHFVSTVLCATGREAVRRALEAITTLWTQDGACGREPTPWIAWAMELVFVAERAIAGEETVGGVVEEFRRLRNARRRLNSLSRRDELAESVVAGLMDRMGFGEWGDVKCLGPRIVFEVWRTVPQGLRPGLRGFRRALSCAFLRERARRRRMATRFLCLAAVAVLAPGRWARRARRAA